MTHNKKGVRTDPKVMSHRTHAYINLWKESTEEATREQRPHVYAGVDNVHTTFGQTIGPSTSPPVSRMSEPAVPEVGLEVHSGSRKHWTPAETCGIRPDPAPVRPGSSSQRVDSVHTPILARSKLAATSCAPHRRDATRFCSDKISAATYRPSA